MFGVLAACIVFFVGGSIYGIAKYGAFEKAIGGNLWGMLAIFWGVLGALVSAGIALLFYAWRGPAGPYRRGAGNGTMVLTAKNIPLKFQMTHYPSGHSDSLTLSGKLFKRPNGGADNGRR
jgi:hypothetical protein